MGILINSRDASKEQLEHALRESEEKYRNLVERAGDGVVIIQDGLVMYANPKLAEMWQGAVEWVVGRPIVEFIHPDAAPEVVERYRRRMAGEPVPAVYETALQRRDGGKVYAEISGAVITYQGKPADFVIVRDITERKRTEEKIAGELKLLRTLIDHMPDLIYVKDVQHRYLAANQAIARFMGAETPDTVVGRTDVEFYPAEMAARFESDERQVMHSGEPMINLEELVLSRSSGELRWIATSQVPLRDRDGACVGLVGIGRDITDHKRVEEALRESRLRLELALKGADLGMYDWNMGTGDIFVNDRYAEMLGFTVEEIEMLSIEAWREMVHPDDAEQEAGALARELVDPFPLVETEYRMRTRDGNWRWILDRGKVVECDAEGEPLRVSGTHLDITPRKRAEEERAKLQAQVVEGQKMKAIGQLAAGVAHDFNNLLTGINGYAELLRSRMASGDPQREMADRILVSGQSAAQLVSQLLAFSRKQMVAPRMLDLNEIVGKMEPMLRHMMREDIELVTDLAHDVWPIRMDPAQVEQIIVNLSLNARDAMPDGGRMTVRTSNVMPDKAFLSGRPEAQTGPHVLLTISDTGSGMTAEVKERLFEPFFTTKEVGKGTGLGLASVYGIVKQNNGEIVVDSEPGRGTSVSIYLPGCGEVVQQAGGGAGAPAAAGSPPGSETILIVEDHEAVLELVQQVLEDLGYRVLTASNGRQALELATQHRGSVDLLVTDVVMPGMHGREVAARLSSVYPGLKVVYMSGYADDVIQHHQVSRSGAAFLQKPFDPKELARKVRHLLDG